MGFKQLAFVAATLLLHGAQAGGVTSYGDDFGFIGYSIRIYQPECAWACLFCITAPLNCTTGDMAGAVPEKRDVADEPPALPSGDGWEVTLEATPQCQQDSDFFLQTVAYCIKSRCADVPLRTLDNFWDKNVPFLYDGDKKDQPVSRQGYTGVLGAIKDAPSRPVNSTVLLNYTAAVPDEVYQPEYDAIHNYAASEVTHERYGLVIFLSGVVMPIAFSLLRFLPWPASWVARFNAYLVNPPAVGSQHSTPVWGLGIMPTRGQALFIAYFWLINIFLSALGYEILPGLFYDSQSYEVQTYLANRFGVLSFAHLPLVFLYAGRNNILLWLTNWSHSTFLLMHRWAAFLCMLHAVLHSLVYLNMAVAHIGGLDHAVESVQPYWYWGIIATLSMSIMVVASIQPVRQKMYELFLASHIALAVMAIVGCYYHITPKYDFDYGYQTWLYISIALWVFDRAARLFRSLRGGVKRAFLTPIDDDYYRLDIPGATASGHIYLHFPTVSLWRIWENHPFSVAGVARCSSHMPSPVHAPVEGNSDPEAEKTVQVGDNRGSRSSTGSDGAPQPYSSSDIGVVLFIRKHDGITSLLSKRGIGPKGIPVLVEGSYAPGVTFLQDGHVSPTHNFPHLICIAGGVGITGILPSLDSFTAVARPIGRKKLYWGVRTMPLVHSVERMLGYDGKDALERRWGDVDVTLSVGERFDLRSLLEADLCSRPGGTTVVVCGPPGMADDVRCIVSGLSRHNGANGPVLVKLIVESFSW